MSAQHDVVTFPNHTVSFRPIQFPRTLWLFANLGMSAMKRARRHLTFSSPCKIPSNGGFLLHPWLEAVSWSPSVEWASPTRGISNFQLHEEILHRSPRSINQKDQRLQTGPERLEELIFGYRTLLETPARVTERQIGEWWVDYRTGWAGLGSARPSNKKFGKFFPIWTTRSTFPPSPTPDFPDTLQFLGSVAPTLMAKFIISWLPCAQTKRTATSYIVGWVFWLKTRWWRRARDVSTENIQGLTYVFLLSFFFIFIFRLHKRPMELEWNSRNEKKIKRYDKNRIYNLLIVKSRAPPLPPNHGSLSNFDGVVCPFSRRFFSMANREIGLSHQFKWESLTCGGEGDTRAHTFQCFSRMTGSLIGTYVSDLLHMWTTIRELLVGSESGPCCFYRLSLYSQASGWRPNPDPPDSIVG